MTKILLSWMELGQNWCFDTLHKYIRPGKTVAIIPFGFRDYDAPDSAGWDALYSKERGIYYELNINGFIDHGVKESDIRWIDYYRTPPPVAREIVANADIVYMIGGLPDLYYERIEQFGLSQAIKNHNGLVMGYSAGALIMLDRYLISPDSDYPEYKACTGLNLAHSFGIEVNFENQSSQMESIRRFIRETGLPVYAIEDEGLLVVEGKKITPVGRVQFFPGN